MRLYSWNVNGIRAVAKKGFVEWVQKENPDILCIQETKAQKEQLDTDLINIKNYESYFMEAQKKGYSGVAVYTKQQPISVSNMGIAKFDDEGRTIVLEYDGFYLINAYFPNSQAEGKRLDYKLEFCDAILKLAEEKRKTGKGVLICGDYNIAHQEIDLANPKQNEKNPGYLPEEREWMTKFLNNGYVDIYRKRYPKEVKYSWWSYRTRARDKNIGWRIDYFCATDDFDVNIKEASILNEVLGSDHCPVTIEL